MRGAQQLLASLPFFKDQKPETTGELINWGILIPQYEDGALQALLIHSLVRDFCRDQQKNEIWRSYLYSAATFYTNQIRPGVWYEIEASELLMEAEDFHSTVTLLSKVDPTLSSRGYGRYLENQYNRLVDKLDQRDLAVAKFRLGNLLWMRSDYAGALQHLQFSLEIEKRLGNRTRVGHVIHHIGIVHESHGDYDVALQQYQLSLEIAEERGDRVSVASTLHQIGNLHHKRGDRDAALHHYQLLLEIEEELDNRVGIATSLHQIGVIHQEREDYDAALQSYQLSLKTIGEIGDRAGIAASLHQIGVIHQERGDYDAALQHLQSSLKIEEELGNNDGVAISLYQIGRLHYLCGSMDTALQHYQLSLKIFKEIGDRPQAAASARQIGSLLTEIGHYAESFRYFCSTWSIFPEMQPPFTDVLTGNLSTLRAKWGKRKFDDAWLKVTGETWLD